MRVCIIGWYGTETIGDRGILAGILSAFHSAFGNGFSVSLGSLCPYFSERTIQEDAPLYRRFCGHDVPITLFDSRVTRELDAAIAACDLLIMGGGPLMHINGLFMIEYAFKVAKKKGKKTMLYGCGVGPFSRKRHQKSAVAIAECSDKIILRDEASARNLEELNRKYGSRSNEAQILTSLDPSIQCLLDYPDNHQSSPFYPEKDYIALNMRFFPQLYGNEQKAESIDSILFEILKIASERFPDTTIRLIPMGYFHLSHDDRDFLNMLKIRLNKPNVEVQNIILTLEQTMQVFQHAAFNIGMRFHSVVFQTILSGKNFILDYTEPQKGKISGFLTDIGGDAFYRNKYFNLQTIKDPVDVKKALDPIDIDQQFVFDRTAVIKKLEIYTTTLRSLA